MNLIEKGATMNEENQACVGNVRISEDVIASIVTIAVAEVEGVSIAIPGALDSDRWTKKAPSKGVRVNVDGDDVSVDVFVNADYGIKMPQTSMKLQKSAKAAVESMTGLNVRAINVTVAGVNFAKEKKAE